MAERQALTDAEIGRLATDLLAYQWSWRIDDAPGLVAAFGWVLETTEPNWVAFDDGFGMGSGTVFGRHEHATRIELQVSPFTTDDTVGRAEARDAFAGLAAALTSTIGEPSTRKPGRTPEIRWAGDTTTLSLFGLSNAVQLQLATNSYMREYDEIVAAEDEGLL